MTGTATRRRGRPRATTEFTPLMNFRVASTFIGRSANVVRRLADNDVIGTHEVKGSSSKMFAINDMIAAKSYLRHERESVSTLMVFTLDDAEQKSMPNSLEIDELALLMRCNSLAGRLAYQPLCVPNDPDGQIANITDAVARFTPATVIFSRSISPAVAERVRQMGVDQGFIVLMPLPEPTHNNHVKSKEDNQ